MTGATAARVALSLLAVLLIAWFGLLARNEHLGYEASLRIEPRLSDTGWKRSLDDLRDAELLDPGTEWRTVRANYLLLRDRGKAARLAWSVVREEPDNLVGWEILSRAARGHDPRIASRARAEIQRLSPSPTGG